MIVCATLKSETRYLISFLFQLRNFLSQMTTRDKNSTHKYCLESNQSQPLKKIYTDVKRGKTCDWWLEALKNI